MNRLKAILLFLVVASFATNAQTKQDILGVARNVNSYFVSQNEDPTKDTNVGKIRPSSLWTRAVYYEGLMALYEIDPKQDYIDYTDRWAEYHHWTPRNGIGTNDADDQCCAQTYLDRYIMTGNAKMMEHVKENLDRQMKTKIGWWTWIDAIQMSFPVYSRMTRATGDCKYLDHAMKMYTWSRDTCGGGLLNVKEGLWWRDADYVPPYKTPDGKNCYWSRGSGWVYAALVRVVDDINLSLNGKSGTSTMKKSISSKDMKRLKKYRKSLLKDFKMMSKALVGCQREDGFWNPSLVSEADYPGKELTGTALFLYGMSWGIRNGILPAKTYAPVCERAWKAMVNDAVHKDGFLGYVQGTGKDPSAGQPVTFTKAPDFEDYGTGCFLLGACEYYKLLK